MSEQVNEVATEQPATPVAPKDAYVTRSGKTIALKPWTFEKIAEHAEDLRRFIFGMSQIADGETADLEEVTAILPAIKASVQDEDSLTYVVGLADMADLAWAIWEYNEIGTGLGKFKENREKLAAQIFRPTS